MTEENSALKMSEWLKVMLDEVERRKRECEEGRAERQRRSEKADDQEK